MFLNRIKSSSESRWARVEAMVGRVYSALSKSPSFSMTHKRIIFLFEGGTQGGTFFIVSMLNPSPLQFGQLIIVLSGLVFH